MQPKGRRATRERPGSRKRATKRSCGGQSRKASHAGQLVKRVAVGTSAVQLQLGKGQLDGAELLVRATADGLEIRLTAPPGVNGWRLGIAIADRLARRGLRVANVEVE